MILWEIKSKLDTELLKYLEYYIYDNEIYEENKKYNLYNIEEIEEFILKLKGIKDIKLKKVYFDHGKKEILEKIKFNKFLREEFEIKGKRNKIYIELEYKESYLSNEIVSYILSELELKYKEFAFFALKRG